MSGRAEIDQLVERGRASRLDGDEDGARAAFAKAFELTREAREAEAMGEAALSLAAAYISGAD